MVQGEKSLFGVSADKGELLWKEATPGETRFGSFFCVNAKTGAKCWSDTLRHNRFASTLDLGKVLVSLPATGWLIFFKPDSAKYRKSDMMVNFYRI